MRTRHSLQRQQRNAIHITPDHILQFNIFDQSSLAPVVEYYFFGENGEQLAPVADASGDLGIRRSKASLDISMKEKLMFVPGIYRGEFEMAVGSDGKPMLKLLDIDYVGKCNM